MLSACTVLILYACGLASWLGLCEGLDWIGLDVGSILVRGGSIRG